MYWNQQARGLWLSGLLIDPQVQIARKDVRLVWVGVAVMPVESGEALEFAELEQ